MWAVGGAMKDSMPRFLHTVPRVLFIEILVTAGATGCSWDGFEPPPGAIAAGVDAGPGGAREEGPRDSASGGTDEQRDDASAYPDASPYPEAERRDSADCDVRAEDANKDEDAYDAGGCHLTGARVGLWDLA